MALPATGMTSKDRILSAMAFKPTDRVPLMLRFWSLGGDDDNIPFNWRDPIERVEHTLALGLDDTLTLQPPLGYVEEYNPEELDQVSSYTEHLPPGDGDRYPLLKKVYQTPAGPLQTIISLTDDWPYGDDVKLFDDYNLSRLKEPLIKSFDDLPRLKYLLGSPSPTQISEFRERARILRAQAGRLSVVLDGGWVALGDAAIWLCGIEPILFGQMDHPEFVDSLLDVIAEWELSRIGLLLEENVDVIVHMAWYETTDFWTPANYRKLLKPRLLRAIERVHQAGRRFRYIITKAWNPYIPDFLTMHIDCLTGVDPVQDRIDLADLKRRLGHQICLMGGLNSAIMFSQWSDTQIRKAAEQAFVIMSPGSGFIAYPVDAVFNTQSWDKVEVLLHTWHALNG
jgi:hypothetical protein